MRKKSYEALETESHRRRHRALCLRGGLLKLELHPGHRRREEPRSGRPGGREDPLLTQPDPGTADGKSDGKSDGKAGDSQDGTQANDPATAESGSYFSTARLNRQQARDNALSLLQEAAKDEKADQTAVDEANASIQTMADATVTEAQIENLITAKGYTDCVAFLGEDSISVVVSALDNGMTDADAARIGEIVMEQTGLKADQIKIIEAE